MSEFTVEGSTIPELLGAFGRPCLRLSEGVWRSQLRNERRGFPFLVHLSDDYIEFAVIPFLRSPKDEEKAAVLYLRLLELNQSLLMAKFAIDDDLDVILAAEYPLANLDVSEFEDAINVLTYYAAEHYRELRELCI